MHLDMTKRDLLGKNTKQESNSPRKASNNNITLQGDLSDNEEEEKIRSRYTTKVAKKEKEDRINDQDAINYVSNFSEPNESDNLFDIIYKLKHNTDLNILIKTINKILVKEGKQPFDKSDLAIALSAKELDKFSKHKSMNKNFAVSICYSLFDNK